MAEKWAKNAGSEIIDVAGLSNDAENVEFIAAIIQRHYEAAAKCQPCDGTGFEGGKVPSRNECPRCGGKGRIVP